MKMQFMRRLALLCAVLACGALLALPAAAAQTEAPCAEDGDMDYIRSYVVTVDPREEALPTSPTTSTGRSLTAIRPTI